MVSWVPIINNPGRAVREDLADTLRVLIEHGVLVVKERTPDEE
jgi:hypothetical protein